jgi:hypothetical protein
MRKRIMSILFALAFITGCSVPMVQHATSESHAKPRTVATHTATPKPKASLPACKVEDGNGMALCMWDGIVSGDCEPDYVGGNAVSALCLKLYALPASDHTYQGAKIHVPSGKALAEECVDEWNLMSDKQAKAEGFTLEECFKAQMDE